LKPRQSRPKLLQAMIDAFRMPDLRRRILITFGLLIAFRFIAHIPLARRRPGGIKEPVR
jgi:preprotein translocase subunit SecY